MERVKIVRESWIPKEERLEYPTFNKEDTVLAELIMRSYNSKFSNYDGVDAIVCYFETLQGEKFRAFVFPRNVNGRWVWSPEEGSVDFHSINIEDELNDGEGELFLLTFKKNGKGKVYLAKAF